MLVLIALPAGATLAGRKADLRLLQRIERVDGKNSGLDADTVQGLTPEAMNAQLQSRVDALEAKVDALTGGGAVLTQDQLYAHASRDLQTSGAERLVRTQCDSPRDVALNCSGGAYDGSVDFPITWAGVVRGDGTTTPDACMIVVGGPPQTPNLEVTVRCLHVP
jgi:hypothetical protein